MGTGWGLGKGWGICKGCVRAKGGRWLKGVKLYWINIGYTVMSSTIKGQSNQRHAF